MRTHIYKALHGIHIIIVIIMVMQHHLILQDNNGSFIENFLVKDMLTGKHASRQRSHHLNNQTEPG